MKYKACIFDMDGTVLNTLDTIAYYGNNALQKFGFSTFPTDAYKEFVGNGAVVLIHRMLEAQGADNQENFEKVFPDYVQAYEENSSYLTAPYDGILEVLGELKARGIRTAVLTNKPEGAALLVRAEFFGEDAFDLCIGQTDARPIKPAPDGALYIAEEFGLDPKECLYIGDTWVDMDTGKSAGMDTVGVLWGFREKEELVGHDAKYIIEKPQELLELV